MAEFIPNFNLWAGNRRLRRVYAALTDDYEIVSNRSGRSYVHTVSAETKIVHEGQAAAREDAEASCATVVALMDCLDGMLERTRRLSKFEEREGLEPPTNSDTAPASDERRFAIRLIRPH